MDPKQAVFALIGVALGCGFIFLVAAQTYRTFQGDSPSDEATDSAPTQAHKPLKPLHKLQPVAADLDTYAFFSLLDGPAPRRDAPHIALHQPPKLAGASAKATTASAQAAPSPASPPPKAPPLAAKAAAAPAPAAAAHAQAQPPQGRPQATPAPAGALGARAEGALRPPPTPSAHGLQGGVPSALLDIDFEAQSAPAPEKPAQGVGRARFTVQVGAFQDADAAERLMQSLSARGFDAHLKREVVPGQGAMHRVRVGRFSERDDAERYRKLLSASDGRGAIITGM
jgi:DedD protein